MPPPRGKNRGAQPPTTSPPSFPPLPSRALPPRAPPPPPLFSTKCLSLDEISASLRKGSFGFVEAPAPPPPPPTPSAAAAPLSAEAPPFLSASVRAAFDGPAALILAAPPYASLFEPPAPGSARAAEWAGEEARLSGQILAARAHLPEVAVPDAILEAAARLCLALGTDGLRGELTLMRTARALASLDGAATVTLDHLREVAPSALGHRLRRNPLDEAGSEARIARALAEVVG